MRELALQRRERGKKEDGPVKGGREKCMAVKVSFRRGPTEETCPLGVDGKGGLEHLKETAGTLQRGGKKKASRLNGAS